MVKIKAIIQVHEDEIKAESGLENLDDAIRQELGWLHGVMNPCAGVVHGDISLGLEMIPQLAVDTHLIRCASSSTAVPAQLFVENTLRMTLTSK